ncbi:MAG: hypothetical protein WC554_11485 [Clostridia bacterium]
MIKCTHEMSDLSLHCVKCGKPLSEIVKMKTESEIKARIKDLEEERINDFTDFKKIEILFLKWVLNEKITDNDIEID